MSDNVLFINDVDGSMIYACCWKYYFLCESILTGMFHSNYQTLENRNVQDAEAIV